MSVNFKLGYVGRDLMGRPMALSLIRIGLDIAVYARRVIAAAHRCGRRGGSVARRSSGRLSFSVMSM